MDVLFKTSCVERMRLCSLAFPGCSLPTCEGLGWGPYMPRPALSTFFNRGKTSNMVGAGHGYSSQPACQPQYRQKTVRLRTTTCAVILLRFEDLCLASSSLSCVLCSLGPYIRNQALVFDRCQQDTPRLRISIAGIIAPSNRPPDFIVFLSLSDYWRWKMTKDSDRILDS